MKCKMRADCYYQNIKGYHNTTIYILACFDLIATEY